MEFWNDCHCLYFEHSCIKLATEPIEIITDKKITIACRFEITGLALLLLLHPRLQCWRCGRADHISIIHFRTTPWWVNYIHHCTVVTLTSNSIQLVINMLKYPFQLHQSSKMKRCWSICLTSRFEFEVFWIFHGDLIIPQSTHICQNDQNFEHYLLV